MSDMFGTVMKRRIIDMAQREGILEEIDIDIFWAFEQEVLKAYEKLYPTPECKSSEEYMGCNPSEPSEEERDMMAEWENERRESMLQLRKQYGY